MRPLPLHIVAFGLAALSLGACRSFEPPTRATLMRIAPMPLAERLEPGRFELELLSPGLAGTFDAVWATAPGGLRLQVFPDVGGKLLDLRVERGAVVADLAGASYRADPPLDRANPHLALVLAMLMAELAAPVDAARVLGERPADDGRTEVQLRPALGSAGGNLAGTVPGSGEVIATLADTGAIEEYRFVLGVVRLRLTADGIFTAQGLSGRLRP